MANHTFFTIDGHTCGNPVRVVAGGAPALTGSTMIERRAHFLCRRVAILAVDNASLALHAEAAWPSSTGCALP
jgi:proline racemase